MNTIEEYAALQLAQFSIGGYLMYTTYERPFRALLSSIAPLYPETADLLDIMAIHFGEMPAYQAAEVILCLQARVEMQGIEAASVLTEDDLDSFPYFETMHGNVAALELMVDVLETYAAECQMLGVHSP
jgi:hypothetical protein